MTRLTISALVLLAACGESLDAQLLVPDDVEVDWDHSFNAMDDGVGALIPIDVMVYDGSTGEPLADTEIELVAEDGAWLVNAHAVVPVEPDSCGGCVWFWDTWTDRTFAFDAVDPTMQLSEVTDRDGIARVYVFVDAFAEVDADVVPLTVEVSADVWLSGRPSLAVAGASFDLVPR